MAKYLYGYHEERGFADLYVTDVNGNTVWEVHYPSFYESNGEMLEDTTVFEDGFMKNADDIEGLEKYLKSISVINRGDELVDRDEDMYDDDEDEYAAGGTIEAKIKKKLKNAFELPIQIAVYVPSTRDKDIIITKREMEARVDEVERFLANAFGGFSAVKVEGGFESSDKGLIQEDAVRVVAFASKENENGVPFEQSFESLMNQVKDWCYKWSQQSIGVEFENDLFYVDTETKFADGGLTWYKYDNNVYESRLGDFDIMIYPETQKGYWSVYVLEGKNKVGAEFDIYGIKNAKDKAYSIIRGQYMADGDSDTEGNYKRGGYMAKGGEVDLSPYKDIQKLNMIYKSGSKWYAWGSKYNVETKGEGYTKKEALQDLDNHLSYVSEDDEFADGGDIAESNLQMLRSNAKAIKHHAEELEGELNDDTQVEAWVVAKGERAATDLSDITHYLDGKKFYVGGLTAGRWYKDNSGEEFKYIGKNDDTGELIFTDGSKRVNKTLDDFGGRPKENKLFGFFEDGGIEEGVDLFEDYDEMPASVVETLSKYDLESGDYRELEKALQDLKKYGYTFDYELDGQPYDLRKIGQKGKSEFYAKGGSIKSIEKRVAEVNELIKRGNELGIEVVDEGNTWQAPMKYKPLKYTNGVLYISYEVMDLYKYNREYVQDWEKKSYKIGRYESSWGHQGEEGSAQREALTEIARMYRKPLKSYDTYGYFEDGGEVNKVNPEEIKVKIEQILDKVVPSFYKGVSIRKNIFDTGNNIRIFIAASDYKINGVSGQLPQVVSLSLDLSDMDLHPQVYGGNGGQRVERKPNMSDPNEKYLAMKGVKVPFRTPQPNEKAVLDAIKRFAENYKKTLAENREVLLYQDVVDYDKLLAGSQYSLGGFLLGAAAGAVATKFLSSKSSKTDKTKVEDTKELTWKEKFNEYVDGEGFDSAVTEYSEEIKDKRFNELKTDYLVKSKALKKYIGSKDIIDSEYDISVQDAIDSEGFDYALDGYNDWEGVEDNKFQTLYDNYKKSRKSLNKYVGTSKSYADGGETYFDKQASMKGGVDYYSVEIDDIDGEQIRGLDYKSLNAAKKVYDKYKKSMMWEGNLIDDIQLVVVYKNGDYDTLHENYADGGMMAKGGTVSDSEILKLKEQVLDLYGNDEMFDEYSIPKNFTSKEINQAIRMYLDWVDHNPNNWGGGDSNDVEIVGDIILYNRGEAFYNLTHEREVKEVLKTVKRSSYSDGGMMAEGGSVGFNQSINNFVKKLNSEYSDSYLYTVDFGKKYAKISHQPVVNGELATGKSTWGFIALQDDNAKGFVSGDLLKAAGFNTPAKGARGNILNGTARYDKYSPQYGKGWRSEGGMAKGGTFAAGVKAIEKRLVGTKVNPKYQKEYGKTYDKAEAHEAASKIKGKMRAMELANKYKKKKLDKGGLISEKPEYINLRELEDKAHRASYRAKNYYQWLDSTGHKYMDRWNKIVLRLRGWNQYSLVQDRVSKPEWIQYCKERNINENYNFGDVLG